MIMPVDCFDSPQTHGCEWSVVYLWRWTGLLERLVFIGLALMLARIVFIVIRVSYLLARRAGSTDTTRRARSKLAAELCRKRRSLRAIFSTAPYLGLVGTCLGIVETFSVGYSGSPSSILRWLTSGIEAAFLSTPAGILVAVPAICFHNYLCPRLDSLKRELSDGPLVKSRFPLKPRLSVLSYAVIAAPTLAMMAISDMMFPSFHPPKGLHVGLMTIGANETKAASVEPIVIAVVSTKPNVIPVLYVNSKKTPWDKLEDEIRTEVSARPPQSVAYVGANEDVLWKYVTDVTDTAEGLGVKVVLLTAAPESKVPRKSAK